MGSNFLGSVSYGTMRAQDLIPAFLKALGAIADSKPDGFDHSHASALSVAHINAVPAWVADDGDDCDWWDSEEAGYLMEELFDGLDSCAPDGYYFGSHPGDGADYGFWEAIND
jgi:hypothetical protein